MNTQELANQIVERITRAVLGNPLLEGPQHAVLVRAVKRRLDRALADDLARTRNNHPVKIPAVPRPVFDHTRPEGLGVLVQQPKFAFGHIPSEHLCPNCREFGLDGCPNCPGFQEY